MIKIYGASDDLIECVEKDTPDVVILSGVEVKWVVLGDQIAKK